jgi:hypothetical protein
MARSATAPGRLRWPIWAMRVAWLALPVATVAVFVAALEQASGPVRWTVTIGLYAGWGGVLLAVLLPRAPGLTMVRIGGPAALAAAAWAVIATEEVDPTAVAALAWSAGAAAVALAGVTADAFVDGSSYGSERRFALRTPTALLLGPIPLAWLAVMAGAVAGPLLLATRQWVFGGLALAAGVQLAWLGGRALHQLSRRWVVFVPAGMVLHDPMTLVDALLFHRRAVISIGPAAAGDAGEATDVSGGAPGLVLEARLRAPIELSPRRESEPVAAARIRFVPIRGAAVLAEAERRRLPAG